MQREPVPPGLARRQGLAGPFAVEPRLPRHGDGLAVERQAAGRGEIRLAVVIGRLTAFRLAAVATVALQHQRPFGIEPQRIVETGARRRQSQRRERIVRQRRHRRHPPCVDPRLERRGGDSGLPDAAARESFGETMRGRAGDSGVTHPDLLAVPTLALRAGRHRLPEQRPLRAVGRAARIVEVGGDVPPFNAKVRMRAEVAGKHETFSRHHRRETGRFAAKAREALRPCRRAVEADAHQAGGEHATRDCAISAHWRKS